MMVLNGRLRVSLVFGVALLWFGLCSAVARADQFEALSFQAVLDEGALLTGGVSGQLTLDQTTGMITGADFSASTNVGRFDFSSAPFQQSSAASPTVLKFESDTNDAEFDLLIPLMNLDDLGQAAICSIQAPCSGQESTFSTNGSESAVEFGQINGSASTPEPASLLLLGTGLLTGVALVRRA